MAFRTGRFPTQQEIADRAGFSQVTVCTFLQGRKVRLATAMRIAEVLSIPLKIATSQNPVLINRAVWKSLKAGLLWC